MSIAPSPPDREIATFGEPAWDVARLFPPQGQWSEEEYFSISNASNRLVEYSHGHIKVLAMPTMLHQEILIFLFETLKAFAAPGSLGKTLLMGMKVRLWPGKYREPDVLFMLSRHAARMTQQFWEGADLVMEVVSEDRRHDLETKRDEYALARIPEYWIVDPRDQRITVLAREGDAYAVHGEFAPGESATSRLLPGFAVDVAAAFAPTP